MGENYTFAYTPRGYEFSRYIRIKVNTKEFFSFDLNYKPITYHYIVQVYRIFINWFLLEFRVNLFARNHVLIFDSSPLRFSVRVCKLLPDRRTFVLSAYILNFKIKELLTRSFTYTKNINGFRVDPCTIQNLTGRTNELVSPKLVYCK